jgi:hypothetical protein
MHGSRRKIPVKNLVRQRCAEGFNSGVKGLRCEVRKQIVIMNDKESYLGSCPMRSFLISGVETAGSANRL